MFPCSIDEKLNSRLKPLANSPYDCSQFNHLGLSLDVGRDAAGRDGADGAAADSMLTFLFVWVLRLSQDAIENASVPISVLLALLSLFWSVFFSSPPFGRPQ
ncbi:hypothetical protein LX32DRAFT_378646 [Colletotrichum zoysiae]|uniref:Uncharacterized protein n=1 Tax=Colletotrichum zoysiae TaxID=1216348 RepID=A0AAD9HH26_9PEZI|nr:hypothetical protein LX32DRAFT_378646 [Colletotrichum zoysiae]